MAWCVLLPLLVGCSSPKAEVDADFGGAYTAVVRWFVDRSPVDTDTQVVFVDTQGEGFEIGLGLQATIVSGAKKFAQVRFVDDRSEAFGERGETVRDDGIFLAVGPALIDGLSMSIDCDEIITADSAISWTFELRREDERWTLVGPPSTVRS